MPVVMVIVLMLEAVVIIIDAGGRGRCIDVGGSRRRGRYHSCRCQRLFVGNGLSIEHDGSGGGRRCHRRRW